MNRAGEQSVPHITSDVMYAIDMKVFCQRIKASKHPFNSCHHKLCNNENVYVSYIEAMGLRIERKIIHLHVIDTRKVQMKQFHKTTFFRW